jgi:hypothetical protein
MLRSVQGSVPFYGNTESPCSSSLLHPCVVALIVRFQRRICEVLIKFGCAIVSLAHRLNFRSIVHDDTALLLHGNCLRVPPFTSASRPPQSVVPSYGPSRELVGTIYKTSSLSEITPTLTKHGDKHVNSLLPQQPNSKAHDLG